MVIYRGGEVITKGSVLQKCEKFLSNKDSFKYRVCKLIKEGDFTSVLSSKRFVHLLNEGPGKKVKINNLTSLMEPLQKEDIVKVKIIYNGKKKKKYWFPNWINKKQVALSLASKTYINKQIFSNRLIKAMDKDFKIEIKDLGLVYGKSGTCTAFLLRKILEKLIFITFSKNRLSNKLKDKNGDFIGLKSMINQATINKCCGEPFLMPKTAKKIEGIKFLGDTSAHNPLTNVEMRTIEPQIPYIITAYEELLKKL